MNKIDLPKLALFAGVCLASVLFIIIGNKVTVTPSEDADNFNYYSAKVTEVRHTDVEQFSLDGGQTFLSSETITFDAKITEGPLRGEIVEMSQLLDDLYAYQPDKVEQGDYIIITAVPSMANPSVDDWMFVEHDRSRYLAGLVVAFLAAIAIIGGAKGFATIASLALTAGVIFAVYVPSILSGQNIYLSTTIVSVFIIFMSLLLINGANKKTACAIIGNMGGVAVAGLLALAMNSLMGISGMVEQEYIFLTYLTPDSPIDLRALVWGGIVIGSLGAIMDIAMSIASAMNELSETMGNKSVKAMVRSGMNIGKDAIGTMTNTLVLAYIGGSLAMVLLLAAYNKDLTFLLNTEMILVELLQAIVGSMGILFAVPVTVIVAAYWFNKDSGTPKPGKWAHLENQEIENVLSDTGGEPPQPSPPHSVG